MLSRPSVSVVIPNYNYGAYIEEALISVFNQTFQDFEVIVVDDGSNDNSRELLRSLETKYEGRLKVIFQKNSGPSVARNKGIEMSKGNYIAFLDADDFWVSERLSKTVNFLINYPNYAMVYAKSIFFENATGKLLEEDHGIGTAKTRQSGKCLEGLFIQGNFIATGTILIQRFVFEKVGFFDKNFRGGEDLDMWMRIAARYEIGYIPEILVRVRSHGRNITFQMLSQAKQEVLRTKKCLRDNPYLKSKIGEETIKRKVYNGYYNLGRELILSNQQNRGRIWLQKALKIDPKWTKNKIFIYYLFSFFPFIKVIKCLRAYWHSLRKGFVIKYKKV